MMHGISVQCIIVYDISVYYCVFRLQLPVISHHQSCTPDKRKQSKEEEKQETEKGNEENDGNFLTVAQSLQLWEQIQQVSHMILT